MPRWVNSDHLTLLGFVSMFFAGASYALAARLSLAPFRLGRNGRLAPLQQAFNGPRWTAATRRGSK